MAAYLNYPILLGSTKEEEAAGIQDDFSQGGSQHSRVFHSQAYFRFRLMHKVTLAQWNTLKADYDAGPRDVRTLTYHDESPAVTYSVKYIGPPRQIRNLGGDRYIVESLLRGPKT